MCWLFWLAPGTNVLGPGSMVTKGMVTMATGTNVLGPNSVVTKGMVTMASRYVGWWDPWDLRGLQRPTSQK